MKNIITALLVFVAIIPVSFAATTLNCKSVDYVIIVNDLDGSPVANYGIDGIMNDGADVEIEKLYLSQNAIALSLKVDGQPCKFEMAVTRTGHEKYVGRIFMDNSVQELNCIRH